MIACVNQVYKVTVVSSEIIENAKVLLKVSNFD